MTDQPPALQPGQFEHTLFVYGSPRDVVQVRRETALKASQGYVGRQMILVPGNPGQLVRILSVRLEDDLAYPGERGRVIAVCEAVSNLESIKPRPYAPEMEYK